jgi:hypothetical protein
MPLVELGIVAQVPGGGGLLNAVWLTITLDAFVKGFAPVAPLQVTVTLYELLADTFVLVNVAGMLNAVLEAQAAWLLQTLLPFVSVPVPVPTVVVIAAVQDTAFKGCTVNVAATAVPPASAVVLGNNGDAGPNVTAGIPDPPATQPAPDGAPVSCAARCPGVLPVVTRFVG